MKIESQAEAAIGAGAAAETGDIFEAKSNVEESDSNSEPEIESEITEKLRWDLKAKSSEIKSASVVEFEFASKFDLDFMQILIVWDMLYESSRRKPGWRFTAGSKSRGQRVLIFLTLNIYHMIFKNSEYDLQNRL